MDRPTPSTERSPRADRGQGTQPSGHRRAARGGGAALREGGQAGQRAGASSRSSCTRSAIPPTRSRWSPRRRFHLKGVTLRATNASRDAKHSINLVADELARQVKRHRDKRRKRRESRALAAQGPPPRRTPKRPRQTAFPAPRTPPSSRYARVAMSILDRALRMGEARQFKQYAKRVDRINAWEPELELLDDDELRANADSLRERARGGEPLEDLLAETFALVREVSRRRMSMRHFDVQMIGGMVLHDGAIAEMKTGEGKTLTATTAVVLNALAGEGVHVVTVNDYLARRDADWMRPIYEALGLTVGVLQNMQPYEEKRAVLRVRHHVRHELRVRVRLPARQHGDDAGREGPARRPLRRRRQAAHVAPLRDRRRGRQHPHRRGAHAADHLRRPRAGRRPLRAGSPSSPRSWSRARSPTGWTRSPRRTSWPTTTTSSTRSTRTSRSPSAASPRPRSSSASTTSTRPRTARWSTTCCSR